MHTGRVRHQQQQRKHLLRVLLVQITVHRLQHAVRLALKVIQQMLKQIRMQRSAPPIILPHVLDQIPQKQDPLLEADLLVVVHDFVALTSQILHKNADKLGRVPLRQPVRLHVRQQNLQQFVHLHPEFGLIDERVVHDHGGRVREATVVLDALQKKVLQLAQDRLLVQAVLDAQVSQQLQAVDPDVLRDGLIFQDRPQPGQEVLLGDDFILERLSQGTGTFQQVETLQGDFVLNLVGRSVAQHEAGEQLVGFLLEVLMFAVTKI